MSTQDQIYTKGDWIVHARYGVGQVKKKEKKVLEGVKRAFFHVKTFSGEYWLPVGKTDVPHIRPLASEYQIKKALSLIRKPSERLPKDHKKRIKQISESLSTSSLYKEVQVLRDLHGWKMTTALNQSEVAVMERIRKKFLNEWSVVSGKDREELSEKLMEALQTSGEKRSVVETEDEGENKSWLEKVKSGVRGKPKRKNSN